LSSSDVTQKAILLAVSEPESGAWLDALPSSKLGTLLEKTTLQIAVYLRLGISICQPHICTCGSLVDTLSHHGLSCIKNAGRISRHSCLNDILKRAFSSANIPCILEPTGVLRDDGKRPDGITIIPWKKGKSLVWDVTCTDTLAPSHLSESSISPKSAANLAAVLKKRKYKSLSDNYFFVAFAVETLGSWSNDALSLLDELGKLLSNTTGIPQAKTYLKQRISIAIQRGNAASIIGTVPLSSTFKELFYLL
jgi:hypothetical protein